MTQEMESISDALANYESHRKFYEAVKILSDEGRALASSTFKPDAGKLYFSIDKSISVFADLLGECCKIEVNWFDNVMNFFAGRFRLADNQLLHVITSKKETYMKTSSIFVKLEELLEQAKANDAEIMSFLVCNDEISLTALLEQYRRVHEKVRKHCTSMTY